MVAICWSWETNNAAYADVLIMPEQKVVLPSESRLPEHQARSVLRVKQQRVSSFRQLQAISKMVAQLTHGSFQSLGDFDPPNGFKWKPVARDQRRLLAVRGDEQIAFIRTQDAPNSGYFDADRVVPSSFAPTQGIKLCVLALGQGSVGCAGVTFAGDHLGKMLLAKFDKIHRCIRDLRLALQHSCNGLFLKAQLYTSYVWGINYKPFGSGRFGTAKKYAVNVMCD